MPSIHRRSHRRPPVLAALLVAALLAAAAVAGWVLRGGDGSDLRRGSIPDEGGSVDITERTPATYRVDYQVVGLGGDEPVVTSERLLVRRPFESRLESFDSERPPDDGRPRSVQVAALGQLISAGSSSERAVLVRPPAIGASDVRLQEVVDDAVEQGILERRERRVVGGRPCQVLRSGEPLTTGSVTAPSAGQHTDTCIDGAGLVLEELLVVDGEPLLRRVALDVEEGVRLDDELFATSGQTVPLERGGGSFVEVTAQSRTPGAFWEHEDGRLPAGFRRHGRYAVVVAQPEDPNDPRDEERRLTYVSDVLVDGVDAVFVDQGSRVDGSRPIEVPDSAPEVDLGDLGRGRVLLGANGSAVVAHLEGGRFVRVSGTLDVDRLVDVARSLRQVSGGRLTVVEPSRPSAG